VELPSKNGFMVGRFLKIVYNIWYVWVKNFYSILYRYLDMRISRFGVGDDGAFGVSI
jgi:hypothetical protein